MSDAPERAPLSLSRRVAFSILATVLAFSFFEIALRLAGVAALESRPVLPRDGELSVWAFGDSNTWGFGLEDRKAEAWPVVGARLLSDQVGRGVAASNLAVPGTNSTQAVEAYAAALDGAEAPDVAVFLTGLHNDGWVAVSGQYCVEPGDGKSPGGLHLAARRSAAFRLLEQSLARARTDSPRSDCAFLAGAFQALAAGRLDDASDALDVAEKASVNSPWLSIGRGLLALERGEASEAVSQLDAVRDSFQDRPAWTISRAWALRGAARGEEGFESLPLGDLPGELPSWSLVVRGWIQRDRSEFDAARATFTEVARVADTTTFVGIRAREAVAWLNLQQGDVVASGSQFEALLKAVEANSVLSDEQRGWLNLGLALAAGASGEIEVSRASLAAAQRDPTAREAAKRLDGELGGPAPDHVALANSVQPFPSLELPGWVEEGDQGLLEADLRRAAELSREHGVVLAIATYPWVDVRQAHRAAVESFVVAHPGTLVLDFEGAIAEQLSAGIAWDALFLPDSHPTAGGHEVMARVLSSVLTEGLASSP